MNEEIELVDAAFEQFVFSFNAGHYNSIARLNLAIDSYREIGMLLTVKALELLKHEMMK